MEPDDRGTTGIPRGFARKPRFALWRIEILLSEPTGS